MFDFQEWTSWTHLTSTTTKLKSSVPVSLKVIPRTILNQLVLLRDAPGHITGVRLQQDQQDSRWSLLWSWRLAKLAKTYLKRCLTLMSPITEQLQSLSLQSNKISRFPTASLRPLHQLKTLHLNDNNVSSLVIFFFRNVSLIPLKLWIRLAEGDFEEFGDHLQNLWLDNNRISQIPTPTFEDLTR